MRMLYTLAFSYKQCHCTYTTNNMQTSIIMVVYTWYINTHKHTCMYMCLDTHACTYTAHTHRHTHRHTHTHTGKSVAVEDQQNSSDWLTPHVTMCVLNSSIFCRTDILDHYKIFMWKNFQERRFCEYILVFNAKMLLHELLQYTG